MPRPVKLLLPLLCLALFGAGESRPASAQRFGFDTFGQREGLRNINASALLQGRDGLLWIGTEAGAYRYDGYRFEAANLAARGSTFITGLTEDGLGRIWYSTSDAVGYFQGLEGREIPPPAAGFSSDLDNRLSPDPDNPARIYFVSRGTLYSVEAPPGSAPRVRLALIPGATKAHPELTRVSGLVAVPGARFWLGCGTAICSVHGPVVRVYTEKDGVPAEPWLNVFIDRKGFLWARGDHHIVRLDPEAGRFIDIGHGLPGGSLSMRQPALREDRQGRILANLSVGLGVFADGSWTVLRKAVDLPTNVIRTMALDHQGSPWVSFDGQGIGRWLGYDRIENWTSANGLSRSTVVWNFARDARGDLWIGTEAGLERLKKGSKQIEILPDKHLAGVERVQSVVLTRDGHIWTGSDDGTVSEYDPVSHALRRFGPYGGVFQLVLNPDGQIWVCAMNGLFRIDPRQKANAPEAVIQGHVYEGGYDNNGDAWFATAAGLFRYSGGAWSRIHLPPDYKPTFSTQIAIARDRTIWLSGVDPAIYHLKIDGDSAHVLERFSAPPLSSKAILLVALDRRGWLWIGSDSGLDVYNGVQWRHLDIQDGLVSNDTDSDGFYEDTDGTIWIGTSGGISHLLHPELIFPPEEPTLRLSKVAIGNVLLAPGVRTKVPWSSSPLTANLSTLDFDRSSRVTFRYKVEGLHEDWQDSPKHDLRYPPPEPGSYRLAVMAVDPFNGLHSPVSYIEFEITPPWWRSTAMHALEILLTLLVIAGAWRWSVRRHLAAEHHLQELVRIRTQELENEKAELLRARAALQVQASHDSLTGLLNHNAILRALHLAIERCSREGSTLGVVLADIDHFKQVNDTHGHLAGDMVLQEYGQRIKAAIRTYDEVGRYGGEELLILLPGLDPAHAATRLAELHRSVCAEPIACKDKLIRVTCSFGFTWLRPGADTVEALIDRADNAMYAAKRNGRNRIEIWEDIEAARTSTANLNP